MTECKSESQTTYEVEIELKQYHNTIHISELNNVLCFVLKTLFGKRKLYQYKNNMTSKNEIKCQQKKQW